MYAIRSYYESQLEQLVHEHGLEDIPHAVLFSNKAYLQRGGRYVSDR